MIAATQKSPPRKSPQHVTPTTTTTSTQIQVRPNESYQGNQLALTAQAVESWGNKRVSWGRTHNGKRFAEVYEDYQSYVEWISARARNATPAMQDFITYCQARSDMEKQALRKMGIESR